MDSAAAVSLTARPGVRSAGLEKSNCVDLERMLDVVVRVLLLQLLVPLLVVALVILMVVCGVT